MSGHGGDEDDLGQQAWPGFVDILSSVLIMFVFFLMITATALYFHTVLFKGKMMKNNETLIKEQVQKKLDAEMQTVIAENKKLREKLEHDQSSESPQLKQNVEAMNGQPRLTPDYLKIAPQKAQPTEMAETKNQNVQVIAAEKTMIVFFEPDTITLTDQTKQALTQFMSGFNPSTVSVDIVSSKNTSDSIDMIARKVTVARLLNVRNGVMQAKVPSAQISASMIDSNAINGNLDWVKIIVKDKGSKS